MSCHQTYYEFYFFFLEDGNQVKEYNDPASTRHSTNVDLWLGQRCRRRANIKTTLVQFIVLTGENLIWPQTSPGFGCEHSIILTCKVKRQYPLSLQVIRYRRLALQNSIAGLSAWIELISGSAYCRGAALFPDTIARCNVIATPGQRLWHCQHCAGAEPRHFLVLGVTITRAQCLTWSDHLEWPHLCPIRRKTLNECWLNVGPPSTTLDQR